MRIVLAQNMELTKWNATQYPYLFNLIFQFHSQQGYYVQMKSAEHKDRPFILIVIIKLHSEFPFKNFVSL